MQNREKVRVHPDPRDMKHASTKRFQDFLYLAHNHYLLR